MLLCDSNMKTKNNENGKILELGIDTSRVFAGKSALEAIELLYNRSAKDLANLIVSNLSLSMSEYTLADFGSFKGELLQNTLGFLKSRNYCFKSIAIDRIYSALEENKADVKIVADLDNVPLEDRSIDVGIMRYALQWNGLETQIKILRELARTCRKFAIIQHVGADNEDPTAWRDKISNLLSGKDLPKLTRSKHYYSSRKELEELLQKEKIKYKIIEERKVNYLSDVFIERYGLDKNESEKTREILGNKDYIMKTTFMIFPK